MCHQKLNDKGWLRQYLPQPSQDQYYQFIEGVGKRLDAIPHPTDKQEEQARDAAFREMMGW